MNLKERIIELLQEQNYSYSDLAKYVNLTEADLDRALDNNSIEIRTLELISKSLRIPLYSFFREQYPFSGAAHSVYTNRLWEDEQAVRTELEKLRKEVEQLKAQLSEKDLLLEALEEQLKKKM